MENIAKEAEDENSSIKIKNISENKIMLDREFYHRINRIDGEIEYFSKILEEIRAYAIIPQRLLVSELYQGMQIIQLNLLFRGKEYRGTIHEKETLIDSKKVQFLLLISKRMCMSSSIKEINSFHQSADLLFAKRIASDISKLTKEDLKANVLNRLLLKLNERVGSYLKDLIPNDLQEKLYEIILLTRSSDEISLIASNAATILNRVNFSFANKDLSNIKIPDADFSGGLFINTNFESSDLSKVNFTQSNLYYVNFRNCIMNQVNFGCFPPLIDQKEDFRSLSFSPLGNYIAAGDNESIIIGDMASKKQIGNIRDNAGPIISLTFSPCENYLASINLYSYFFKIGDTKTFKKFREFEQSDIVVSVKFSPYSKYIYSGNVNGFITFGNIEARKIMRQISRGSNFSPMISATFSPTGIYLASLDTDFRLVLWNLDDQYEYTQLNICDETRNSGNTGNIKFSPDGKYLASVIVDFFELGKIDTLELVKQFNGHISGVRSFDFSPCGRFLASCSDTVVLGDIETGNQIMVIKKTRENVSLVSFSPCGKYLASTDSALNLGYIDNPHQIKEAKGNKHRVNCISFSPLGNYLVSGCQDGSVDLWDMNSKKLIKKLDMQGSPVCSVAYSRDGKYVAAAFEYRLVRIGNLGNFNMISLNTEAKMLCFSPCSEYLVSCRANSINLWNIKTRKLIKSFEGHTSYVDSVTYSPCGNYLASWSNNRIVIKIWDIATKSCIKTIPLLFKIHFVEFSLCGTYIISGGSDCCLNIFDILGGKDRVITRNESFSNLSVLSPCRKYLASVGRDKVTKIWDLEAGLKIGEFESYSKSITSLSFSFDGKYLATGSEDCSIKLWSLNLS